MADEARQEGRITMYTKTIKDQKGNITTITSEHPFEGAKLVIEKQYISRKQRKMNRNNNWQKNKEG
jgi:hypothetical protein